MWEILSCNDAVVLNSVKELLYTPNSPPVTLTDTSHSFTLSPTLPALSHVPKQCCWKLSRFTYETDGNQMSEETIPAGHTAPPYTGHHTFLDSSRPVPHTMWVTLGRKSLWVMCHNYRSKVHTPYEDISHAKLEIHTMLQFTVVYTSQ